jgi:hypothetical protein
MRSTRTFSRHYAALGLSVVVAACGGSTLPAKRADLPAKAAPAPPPKPAKEQLLARLRAAPRPAPVLELLPPEAVEMLDTRLKSLSAEQREQVLSNELANSVPLLHLRAGGSSGHALLALATTPAASEELVLAFDLPPQATDEERRKVVALARNLAQRAAQHFLRDRVLDVANAPANELPSLLAVIERAAIAAGRPDIARLALEAAAAAGASEETLTRLGAACAEADDRECFDQAFSAVPEASAGHARLALLKRALDTKGDGDPLVKTWSLLHLGRFADARVALTPVEAKAKTDLRVAAALAVVSADGSACPGLPPGVGSPSLCADAVASREGLKAALADMDAAWQSGKGRDAAAVEVYLGLGHVVPWVTELTLASDAQSLERNFSERYQMLARVLRELPDQKALATFSNALAAGVTAGLTMSRGQRPQIDATRKQELWFAALGTEAAAPRLAVGAVLAGDQPVLPLLPKSAPGALSSARAGLLAWEAVDSADASALEAARGALAEQIAAAPKESVESASAVLLLAELDAVATPNERTHRALAQVSSQLIGQALPPELALRAVLDAAGALERLGRTADALGVLTKAAEIEFVPGAGGDLLTLIRAEKLVLEWDAKKDPQRTALAKALAALPAGAPPPTVAFVIGAWGSPKVLRTPKQTPQAVLEERLGVRAAELIKKGALRGTRVSLRLSYAFHSGVTPEVLFDPMLVPLVRPDLIQKAL